MKNVEEKKKKKNKGGCMAAKTEVWGIVDMGSNTIRLCVYLARLGDRTYKKLLDARETVGLSSYVEDGVMSKEGVKAASKALKKLLRTADLVGCKRTFVFATAAIRNCTNSDEVVSIIQNRACTKIEVLPGKEEARLSVKGACETIDLRSGLFFDIGGGSTELAVLEDGHYEGGISLPFGSLSTWHEFVRDLTPSPEELDQVGKRVRDAIIDSGMDLTCGDGLCGIGGTMRMAIKVASELGGGKGGKRVLTLSDLNLILATSRDDDAALSRIMLEINPARMHTFLPGCVIAREIMLASGWDRAVIAKSGVREGYLLSKMKKLG